MIVIYILITMLLGFLILYLPMMSINKNLEPLAKAFSLFDKNVEIEIQALTLEGTPEYYRQLPNKQLVIELKNIKNQISNTLHSKKDTSQKANMIIISNCAKAVIIENIMKEKDIPTLQIIKSM